MSDNNKFEFTGKQKKTFLIMMVVGIIAVLIGLLAGSVSKQRFWANLLLESVFFTGIAACAIFMIAAHQIGLAGWNIVVRRVTESITKFTLIGGLFIMVIVVGTAVGYHDLYHWSNNFLTEQQVTQAEITEYEEHHAGGHHVGGHETEEQHDNGEHKTNEHDGTKEDHEQNSFNTSEVNYIFTSTDDSTHAASADGLVENPYYDKILDGKEPYLNPPFFILRAIIFLGLWSFIAYKLRRISLAEDLGNGTDAWYMKTKFWSAIFLVIWAVTSSMMAWDWVMSLDPHWYSTLFGWYNFISLWITSMCVTVLLLIYLKSKGYIKEVNQNHLHDLGKYIFGFSIFWTYLWFSQFMLIWYANIPEETIYFLQRKREYNPLFFGNLIINFLMPFLVLMRRDAKRSLTVLTIMAVVLIIGHWNDFFVMIMPATVGADWHISYFEVGMFLFFAGMFLYTVFYQLSKASLIAVKHPFLKESLGHHQ
ncbi:MAG: hypothetical protein H7Y00_11975 [Fimbriimonadaceae bacterium]|nr:hypothetical protein [Chitinophagales bacterium]